MYKRVLGMCIGICLVSSVALAAGIDDAKAALNTVKEQLDAKVARIDMELTRAASALAMPVLTAEDIRSVLTALVTIEPSVIDCSFVDTKGIMTVIEPEAYRKYEGMDISKQDQVIAIQGKKPAASGVFRSVEGIDAFDLGRPILLDNGEFVGSVSVLFDPQKFFGSVILPVEKYPELRVWMMQTDGLIIFDTDPGQVSKNIFTDDAYAGFPSVGEFARLVAASTEGAGTYDFRSRDLDDKIITGREAVWGTVTAYDRQWRIIAAVLMPRQ
jgi:hypothetical protein